tara:strand:+ start:1692 stop:2120 length:429 start_codon:yes stop_codon:yes gene_type:complete
VIFSEYVWQIGTFRLGWSHDLVYDGRDPYLERWIVWFGFTLRLHKFHKGDDDRALHDHPWWFVTLPLQDYWEDLGGADLNRVAAWRPHFRPASHRHIVKVDPGNAVWTFIITGPKRNEWGFWENDEFIHNEAWLAQRDQLDT